MFLRYSTVQSLVIEASLCCSYFGLQVLGAAGLHVQLQQFAQEVGGGHRLGVLRAVVSNLSDGPGYGRLDVVLVLLGHTQGQLWHPLQDRRTNRTR